MAILDPALKEMLDKLEFIKVVLCFQAVEIVLLGQV
jgi:hypothetical protein